MTSKGATISPDHPAKLVGELLLKQALGTTSDDFSYGLLRQLAGAASEGSEVDEHETNFLLSIVEGIKPNDQLEAMLGTQIAATHSLTMTFARRLALADSLQERDSAERTFNKLARTFATQIETLKRHRSGCEQTVNVQQVQVREGGQAIVGNVTQSPREDAPGKQVTASPPALSDARTTPMAIIKKDEERVAIPARDG